MPITTPENFIGQYKDDAEHFSHVLEHLFIPALKKSGFEPIPPKSTGSDVIQAEIIKQLSACELVLCDMSILNPNVFFEFGIRTTLNKPVALVVDDKTGDIPFDTSIINFHRYNSSLDVWSIEKGIDDLVKHIKEAYEKTTDHNALWKYFGVAQTGMFKPEEATLGEKIDLLMQEVSALKNQPKESMPVITWESLRGKIPSYGDMMNVMARLQREREEVSKELLLHSKELQDKSKKEEAREPDSDDKE